MTLRAPSLPTLATAFLVVMAGRASATVYDLSKLASDHPDILYQWTFNVGAHGGMMDATTGDVNLVHAKHASTGREAGVLPGFDVSTLALRAFLHETSRESLPGDAGQIPFSTDNWYYVAITFDPVVGEPNRTRMNAYVADLTAGDTPPACRHIYL